MFIMFLVPGNDVISLKVIFVYYMHSQSSSNTIQMVHIVKNTKFLTINKEGSEKLLASKSCFV